jgi:MoaA/NifB/PqqE/SkfB family radical SAM enzyme
MSFDPYAFFLDRPRPASALQTAWAQVDAQGRLVLPAEAAAQLGLVPGAQVRLEPLVNGLRLHRPVTHLAKLYIEPTNACNLDCMTCFRQGWDEPVGRMSDATFDAAIDGLTALDELPTVYFGGIGEPLSHRKVSSWVARAHALGARTELITNGMLLNASMARELIDAGLDLLWVSIDGASPESYADVRLGAELEHVVANVARFSKLRKVSHHPRPELGIAFVAMKRNIADLPAVLQLGLKLGARHFSVSNVLPVTPELQAEVLYARARNDLAYINSASVPHLSLPKMDFNELTRAALFQAFQAGYNVSLAGHNWAAASNVCNYIEGGTMSVAWTGDVSPCWPLMHTHISYLHGKPRLNHRHVIGNVRERQLADLWLDPDYVAYRQRIQSFAFAPCTFCGGCELAESNQADCIGNTAPACGGCLWAQGVIQCP